MRNIMQTLTKKNCIQPDVHQLAEEGLKLHKSFETFAIKKKLYQVGVKPGEAYNFFSTDFMDEEEQTNKFILLGYMTERDKTMLIKKREKFLQIIIEMQLIPNNNNNELTSNQSV